MKKKFKVGDKVKLLNVVENPGKEWVIGYEEIATVKNVKSISAYSKVILTIETEDGRWAIAGESDVEKINELLKEGDEVIATKNTGEAPDIAEGDVLTVRSNQGERDVYVVVSKKEDLSSEYLYPIHLLSRVEKKEHCCKGKCKCKKENELDEFWEGIKRILSGSETKEVQEEEGMKNDFLDDKPRWDLLPLKEIADLVDVYTAGAKKYAPNNWQKLADGYNRYKAAMFRHLLAYEKGERIDPDTKCMHLAQVAWNAIAMLWMDKNGKGLY